MQTDATTITVIAALIGVIGTLLGVIIAYSLSLRTAKIQHRRIAGAKLRAAFAPIIAKYNVLMKKREDFALSTMFEETFWEHAAAIEEYRCFIPRKSQKDYQEAWENYYWNYGGIYFTDYVVGDNRHEIFQQRINAIFKFTEI